MVGWQGEREHDQGWSSKGPMVVVRREGGFGRDAVVRGKIGRVEVVARMY